jgi:hypothetical protein
LGHYCTFFLVCRAENAGGNCSEHTLTVRQGDNVIDSEPVSPKYIAQRLGCQRD